LKKFIKKASKILKLTQTDPTPEPYRCAGLKLANKYYETAIFFGGIVFSEVDLPGKRKKSKKVLTWFLDLPTRLTHPGSVGPQFFLAESFSQKAKKKI
jgi:hypothetical protein